MPKEQASLKDVALRYARQGLAVLPLEPNGSNPLGRLAPHGYRSATTDPEQVARWWRDCPDANIGAVPGSAGYVVLDLDRKGGKDGSDALVDLELWHGDLPDTLRVETPSGGEHLWFRLPWDMDEAPGNRPLGEGLDVRSGAGYVVMPPSVRPDGAYRPRGTFRDICHLPERWTPAFAGRANGNAPTERAAPADLELDDPRDVERAIKHAAQVAPPAREGEEGSKTTYKAACELRAYGLSEETCFRVMAQHYNPRCEPPWDDSPDAYGPDALASRVASAYRNARQEHPGEHSIQGADRAFADIPAADPDEGHETGDDDEAPALERKTRKARFLSDTEVDEAEPPEWDMVDVLPRRALVALYGSPGTHKSFLALDWAYHLAHGLDWAGHETDEPKRVLYVAGEGTVGIQKRLRAWRTHHGFGMSPNLVVSPDMPRIADDEAWADWVNDMAEAGPFDLIVFDTLAYLTIGLEENSNSDMMQAVGKLNSLRENHGATVLVVHHAGKDGKDIRGASAVFGAADTQFRMDKGQTEGTTELRMDKQKDAEKWRGYVSLTAQEYTVGQDTRGRDITSLALVKGHHNDVPTKGEQRLNQREVEQAEEAKARKQEQASEQVDAEQVADEVDAILRAHAGHVGVMGIGELAGHLAIERFGEDGRNNRGFLKDLLRKYSRPARGHRLCQYVAAREDGKDRRATYFALAEGP